eukprot:gene19083-biopygen3982
MPSPPRGAPGPVTCTSTRMRVGQSEIRYVAGLKRMIRSEELVGPAEPEGEEGGGSTRKSLAGISIPISLRPATAPRAWLPTEPRCPIMIHTATEW